MTERQGGLLKTAYVGLGSNLDDPVRQVQQALRELAAIPQTRCVHASALYRTRPMGSQDQPDYINAVAELHTTLDARSLLRELQHIEQLHQRTREERWGPRTLDLDILLFDEQQIHQEDLQVPHPGMHERPFVLYPLMEIAPDLLIPGKGSLKELLETLDRSGEGEVMERIDDLS